MKTAKTWFGIFGGRHSKEQPGELQSIPARPRTEKIQVRPSVRSMVNEDGAVLLDITQGLLFNLNPVGGFIWHLINGGAPRESIVREMIAVYGIDEQRASTDLDAFVADLEQKAVIEHQVQGVE